MQQLYKTLALKLREHSKLSNDDISELRSFSYSIRNLAPDEDVIRQGDKPTAAVLVVLGVVSRYHLLAGGRRQFLSFHLPGDLPDAQGLFLERMDHAVAAIGKATVASIPHAQMLGAFERSPHVGFAIWRETLIDAAIFREAITNNSMRPPPVRMAHLFCELFYRARAAGLASKGVLDFPIGLVQLGETLGMAIATVNRSLQELRASKAMDFRAGTLVVRNLDRLAKLGQFDPSYLHLRKP